MTLPKLAYLTGEYPRASDTFIQREVTALRDRGHEVLTCSIRTTGPEHLVGPQQVQEHKTTFKVLQAAKNPFRLMAAHLRFMRSPGRYLRALSLAWRTSPAGARGRLYNLIYFLEAAVLAAHLQDQEVTHLHNHIAKASCTVAMLASALSGLPYSFTIHGPDIFFEPDHWRIDEKVARASFVACISEFCRSQVMCFSDQADWDRLHIVHCGVSPALYELAEHKAKNLLFVGRLANVKGVPILLEAVANLIETHPDLRLNLIGDGPDRAALETQAQHLGLADYVKFLGYQNQDQVAAALHTTDTLVLPSFAEGVPVVLMEAMASGVPVISTHIAGVPELVRQGHTGFLIPPGDVPALQAAIDRILQDDAERKAMGEIGRDIVDADFNSDREARWMSELITSYAAGTPPKYKRKDLFS